MKKYVIADPEIGMALIPDRDAKAWKGSSFVRRVDLPLELIDRYQRAKREMGEVQAELGKAYRAAEKKT